MSRSCVPLGQLCAVTFKVRFVCPRPSLILATGDKIPRLALGGRWLVDPVCDTDDSCQAFVV